MGTFRGAGAQGELQFNIPDLFGPDKGSTGSKVKCCEFIYQGLRKHQEKDFTPVAKVLQSNDGM